MAATFPAAANSSDFFGGVGRINLRNNSSIFETQVFTVTVQESLLHSNIPGDAAVDGGLDKYGSGTLILAGTNSLTGFINVDFGTLEIAGTTVANRVNVEITSVKLVVDSAASLTVDDLDISGTTGSGTLCFQNNGGQAVMHTGQIGDFGGKAIATQTGGSMSVTATGAINGLVLGTTNGTATFNLDGGTFSVNRISTQKTGTLNLNGGTLIPQENKTNFLTVTTVNVRAGGARVDTNGFDITIAQNLLHSTIGGDPALDGGLTKSGAGTLTLSGTNSFTGGTTVVGGELVAGVNNALGSGDVPCWGTAVRLTIATGVADAIAENARLTLAGGGAPGVADTGFLLLNGGVETVGSLMLGSTLFTSGTFTSAAFPEYLSGAGSVVVVPEPSVAALGGAPLFSWR